jgi:hypothetical protein
MAFFTPHDTAAQNSGTKLTLSGVTGASTTNFYISNIVLSNTNPSDGADDRIDVAHLAQTTGELALRISRPLIVPADDGGSGRQLTFDYIGKTILLDGSTGTYQVMIANVVLLGNTGSGASTASYYTVQSSTLTLATNDAIRGQATLTLAR